MFMTEEDTKDNIKELRTEAVSLKKQVNKTYGRVECVGIRFQCPDEKYKALDALWGRGFGCELRGFNGIALYACGKEALDALDIPYETFDPSKPYVLTESEIVEWKANAKRIRERLHDKGIYLR